LILPEMAIHVRGLAEHSPNANGRNEAAQHPRPPAPPADMPPLLSFRRENANTLTAALCLACTPRAHAGFNVMAVCALADGRVATGCDKGEIRVWKLSGDAAHAAAHTPAAASPPARAPAAAALPAADGAEGENDGALPAAVLGRVPDSGEVAEPQYTASGRLKQRFVIDQVLGAHNWSISDIDTLADGRLVSCSHDLTLKLWRPSPRDPGGFVLDASLLTLNRNRLASIAMVSPTTLVAVTADSGNAFLWELPLLGARGAGVLLPTHRWATHDGYSTRVSPVDDQYFATVGAEKSLKLWTLEREPRCIQSATCLDLPLRLALLPAVVGRSSLETREADARMGALQRQQLLAVGLLCGKVELYTLPSLTRVDEVGGTTGWIASLAASPDGRLLLTGCDDGVIQAWRRPRPRERPTMQLLTSWPSDIFFGLGLLPGGSIAITNSTEGALAAWDMQVRRARGVEDAGGGPEEGEGQPACVKTPARERSCRTAVALAPPLNFVCTICTIGCDHPPPVPTRWPSTRSVDCGVRATYGTSALKPGRPFFMSRAP
jgi:WD40 repeat protein